MHVFVLVILSSGLLMADVPLPEEMAVEDRRDLRGRWELVGGIAYRGVDLGAGVLEGTEWSIQGDELVCSGSGQTFLVGKFDLDQSQNPPTFVCRKVDTHRTFHGIYRVRGDWIDLAYTIDGPRPTQFVSEVNSDVFLLMLRRIKK